MKYLFSILIISLSYSIFAQDNENAEITPQIEKRIAAEVEKEASQLKTLLTQNEMPPSEIEYALDTFRVEHVVMKRMELDMSVFGMAFTYEQRSASFDKLLNKYFGKLKNLLSAEDKKTLISGQKSWVAFRDAEFQLLNSVYSTLPAYTAYHNQLESDIIAKRTNELFNYYNYLAQNQQ